MIFSRVSLKFRIALSIFVLEAVMVLVVLGQTQSLTRSLTTEIQEKNDQAMVDLLADLSRVALFTVDFGELQQYIERVASNPHVEQILVGDHSGKVVISSNFSHLGKPLPKTRDSAESFWRNSEIPGLGKLAVRFSNKELIDATHQVQKLGYTIALSGMSIIAVAGILFGFILTRRLEVLAATSRRFAIGDLSARCKMEGDDEVAMLGETFDQMAESLTAHIRQLQHQQAALRKAHDVLEIRVAERTRDLLDKNRMLELMQVQLHEEKEEQARLIEELKQTQQQVVQSEKMAAIGHLAAGVAHEINNPIGYVKSNVTTLQSYAKDLIDLTEAYLAMEGDLKNHAGYAGLVAMRQRIDPVFLREDIQDLIRESQQGLERVRSIVQNLKDFSQVNRTDWQYADIHRCLDATLTVVSNQLQDRVAIVKRYGELPEIECLPHQLNQVFMNLLINAAHAIDAKEGQGTVTLCTRACGDQVIIEISDDGCGIDPQHLSKVFDPFFTTRAVGSGTGLGLSTAYHIVKRHQGSITVSSQVGKGSAFNIQLPVVQRSAAGEVECV